MRVLVVDDDADMRALVEFELAGFGYSVTCAPDGHAALAQLENDHYSIAIIDWNMPSMDGIELVRRIRARKARYTYCILVTVRSSRDDKLEAITAGADDFLSKPLDVEMLFSRLSVARRILKLEREVGELKALLPICMSCKSIRDDEGTWTRLEEYIESRTATSFSHGYCPGCYEQAMEVMDRDA